MIRRRKIQARPNMATALSSAPSSSSSMPLQRNASNAAAAMRPETPTSSSTAPTNSPQPAPEVAEEGRDQQRDTPSALVSVPTAPIPSSSSPAAHDAPPTLQQPQQAEAVHRQQTVVNQQQQVRAVLQQPAQREEPAVFLHQLSSPAPSDHPIPSPVEPAAAAPHYYNLRPHSRPAAASTPAAAAQQEEQQPEEEQPPAKLQRKGQPLPSREEKLCDTKTFTMADLVRWRPKTENSVRRKWAERKRQCSKGADGTASESAMDGEGPSSGGRGQAAAVGPRVKINERGEMVVDEESLLLVGNPEKDDSLETIDEDFMPKKLTSLSFRKKAKRGSTWNVLETDLFYEVLAATGTDFGLMNEFIPTRTRAELKQKFNREQRANGSRLDETLRHPVLLDERLRQRVERMLEEMAEKKKGAAA